MGSRNNMSEPMKAETPVSQTGEIAVAAPAGGLSKLPALSTEQLNGIEEFGLMRNWVSFDAPRGKLVCRNLNSEYDEFVGTILESRVVRVMKDEDGNVYCSSSDRILADTGRPGKECAACEDRDAHCFRRWWIAWCEMETGLVFAHTLSQTASMNFHRYANQLLAEGLLPAEALTRLFVEEAKRQKTNTLYRRIQFERLDGSG